MRSLARCLALVLLVATWPVLGQVPGYTQLDPAAVVDFSNCASGGSSSAAIGPGLYWVRVFDEEVFLCYAATCATGGIRLHVGSHTLGFKTATTVSCRSTSSTGDLNAVLRY